MSQSAIWSAVFSPVTASVSAAIAVGDVLTRLPGSNGGYVLATTANLVTGLRSRCVAITAHGGGVGVVLAVSQGEIDANRTGLGAGVATILTVSAAGRLQRDGSGTVVGWCDVDGNAMLNFIAGDLLTIVTGQSAYGVFDVRNFGAAQTNVGAAVLAALQACKLSYGGTVFIPGLATGFWTWVTNVVMDMGITTAPALTMLKGDGAAVRLALTDTAEHACLISNSNEGQVHVSDLVFTGNPSGGTSADCASALALMTGAIDCEVARCSFWGVRVNAAGQGVLRLSGRNTFVHDVDFHGCGSFGANSGLISLYMDTARIEGCHFTALSTFRGTVYARGGGVSLILVHAQAGDSGFHGLGYTEIARCYITETAVTTAQIWCKPLEQPGLDVIVVRGCTISVPVSAPSVLVQTGDSGAGAGFGTNLLRIVDSSFSGSRGAVIADVQTLGHLKMERVRTQQDNKIIRIRDSVGLVEIEDCGALGIETSLGLPTKGFLRVKGEQAELPSNISGLDAWWKAEAGVSVVSGTVTTVADQSTNGRTLTTVAGKEPTFNSADAAFGGYPSIQFDGVDDYLRASAFSLGRFTVFMVATGLTAAGSIFWAQGTFTYLYGGDPGIRVDTRDGAGASAWNNGSWGAFGATPRTVAVTFDGTHAGHVGHINGVQAFLTDTASNSNPGTGTVSQAFTLGADGAGAFPGAFKFAECIIYGRALSAAERGRVETYLRVKYGHYS